MDQRRRRAGRSAGRCARRGVGGRIGLVVVGLCLLVRGRLPPHHRTTRRHPSEGPTRRRAGDLSAATKPEQVATVAASPQAAVHTAEQSRRRTGGVIAGGFAAVTTVGVAPRPARVAPCCDAQRRPNPGRSR